MLLSFFRLTRIREQGLRYLLVCVVLIGICLRCIHLDQKPYWFDETYTMLRVSSYSEQDVVKELLTGQVIQAGDFLKYQTLSSEKGALGTVIGLAKEEPQLPPLYFLVAKLWAQGFGSSKVAMRSLSVMGSLLTFPVLYWLCLELFASSTTGWMAMALFAVSPINLRYAQEIRQYSFWLTLVLLSCVLLLRAIRRPTKLNWGIYTLSVISALYCHLLAILLLIAQGLYIGVLEGLRLSKSVVAYGISLGISIVCLLPWLWITWHNRSAVIKMLAWTNTPLSLSNLIQGAAASLTHIFFAWHLRYHSLFIYLAIPSLILILYALYYLRSKTSIRVWLFILMVVGVTALPFLFADVVLGGRRTFSERYFFASYAGIFLALAYLLTSKLTNQGAISNTRIWQWITVFLFSGSILSSSMGSFHKTWWGWSEFDVEISSIVHQFSHPLVISDMPLGMVLPLARELHPQINLQLLGATPFNHLDFPNEFSQIFLYNPSDRLLSVAKQQNTQPKLVYYLRDPATTNQFSLYQLNGSKNLTPTKTDVAE
jgi:uncharacterized membrane protein